MTNYTTALYDARELAMERMQNDALKMKAEGVVGMHILTHNHSWGPRVMEFFAIGTAIAHIPVNYQIKQPAISLLLNY